MYIPGVDKLIGRLEDVLAKEVELIWRVPHEIKDFKTELENMQLFLIDSDQSEIHAEVEKKWVADIKDKAYEAEDIIDEFSYHMEKHHHDDDISCLSWFLHLLVDGPSTLWVMRQTAHKLKKMKKSITDIAERHAKYKTGTFAHDAAGRAHTRYLKQQQAVRNLRDGAYFIEEENIIGFHRQIESLEKWMTGDKSSSRNVISVHGMGGAGKTTLAAKIYKSQSVGFKLSAWVAISQTYSITELLRILIKKVADINIVADVNKGEEERYLELVETLRGCLKGKKYLIVLDDVWDKEVWKQMKAAFPEDKVSSRILITTRDERNAPSSPYKLHVGELQGSEPWDLFSMKAFADCPDKTCPQELDSFARELVDKCRGLPLALVTLGSHMSSKKQKKEWIGAYNSLYKTADINYIKCILMLSFTDLPYSLKHCFLYCCVFPEDYSIERGRLIRMWMAEGFVESGDEITPEEVAESYLSELVFRGMLLVESRDESGRIKAIKMHDIIRDIALEITKKEKFCSVWDGREEAINKSEAYRWSIIHSAREYGIKFPSSDTSQVRSLIVFQSQSSGRADLKYKFKRLRLLDLDFEYNGPLEVGHLFNLRYLRIKKQHVGKLPGSIGRLLNLQTLDFKDTHIWTLPEGVSKLRQLRHLIMRVSTFIAFDISKLYNLQVLTGVLVVGGDTMRQVGTLTQLKTLEIVDYALVNFDMEEIRKSWEMLGQLKLLQRFHLSSGASDTFWEKKKTDFFDFIILPPNLKEIHLNAGIVFQSRWFESLHNIQEMRLIHCIVSGEQLQRIGALEELVSLEVSLEEDVHFYDGFAKLKQLCLRCCLGEKISFKRRAMPHLESLRIRHNGIFEELPRGIEHLNLQKLEFEIRPEFEDSFQEGIKDGKSKVQHIPIVSITTR